jgi:hypothetical protein
LPGPGDYIFAEYGFKNIREPKSHNKAQHSFGSIEKRFANLSKKGAIPGPGEYQPERAIELLANKKNEIMP